MKISVSDISKAYGAHDIFKNFSLEIESGMRLCVCGPNGTGKSTLLRLIAGTEDLDAGRIIMPKDCHPGYVEQELSEEALNKSLIDFTQEPLHDWDDYWKQWEDASIQNDTETLNLLMNRQSELEMTHGYNPEQRALEILSGLGFAKEKLHLKLRELSGGWTERAKLARVLASSPNSLLLDEPTNHLDMDAVEWLEDFLLHFKGSLVFVAHDRMFMDKVGNHVLYLGSSKPVFRKTNYSHFLELQKEYEMQREREAIALKDEYERKMAFVERFRAKATKARQAASHQKMAKKIEKELEDYRPEPKRKELNFVWPEAPHSEKVMCNVADLSFHFPDGKTMWPPLSFTLYHGSRVALVGHNGCGKSTLLKLIAGKLERCGGNIVTASQMRMGYYTQGHMETLKGNATALGEMRRLSDPRSTEEELMSVMGLFLLGQKFFDRYVKDLSGGEKSRLVLASLFLKRCNFLLLDEPTNHLDLESREALAKALAKFSGTLLLVAHDRWLLSQINAEIWLLSDHGIDVFSSYAEYENSRKIVQSQVESENNIKLVDNAPNNQLLYSQFSKEEQKKIKRAEAEKRNALHKALKPLQTKYAELETELATLLERQTKIEQELADPEVYACRDKFSSLLSDFEFCKNRSEKIIIELDSLEKNIAAQKATYS